MAETAASIESATTALARLRDVTPRDRAFFDCDDLVQALVARQVVRAGTALAGVPEDARASFPAIPWGAVDLWRHLPSPPDPGPDLDRVWQAAIEALDLAARLDAAAVE